MKKLIAILLLSALMLSACQASIDFQADGDGVDIGIDPSDPLGEEESDQQHQESQEQQVGEWFTNPIIIALLIAVVVLVILLVVSQGRRPS